MAWAFAALYPGRTLQLVAISVGHPTNYWRGDHRGEQKQKSWYATKVPHRLHVAGVQHGGSALGLVSEPDDNVSSRTK